MPTFASSSKLPPAAGPKSSGASGSYTSAADLGYVPQPEAGPSTRARDETVGQAGEWEVVAPPPRSSPAPQLEGDAVSAVGESDVVVPARLPARKREFGSTAEDDDPDEARSFKFKRREKQAYLDDDDDLPEIKLKPSSRRWNRSRASGASSGARACLQKGQLRHSLQRPLRASLPPRMLLQSRGRRKTSSRPESRKSRLLRSCLRQKGAACSRSVAAHPRASASGRPSEAVCSQ
jgi:hypothetical protein